MLVDSHFDFLFAPELVVLVVLALAAVAQSLHDIRNCNRLVLHKHHPEVLRAPIFLRTGLQKPAVFGFGSPHLVQKVLLLILDSCSLTSSNSSYFSLIRMMMSSISSVESMALFA